MHSSAHHILCQYLKLPRFPGIQMAVNCPSNFAGDGHVTGALDYHRLEDDEPICVLSGMLDSYEFHSQRVQEAPPNSPAWRVVMPHKHDRQCYPSSMPIFVVCYPPT